MASSAICPTSVQEPRRSPSPTITVSRGYFQALCSRLENIEPRLAALEANDIQPRLAALEVISGAFQYQPQTNDYSFGSVNPQAMLPEFLQDYPADASNMAEYRALVNIPSTSTSPQQGPVHPLPGIRLLGPHLPGGQSIPESDRSESTPPIGAFPVHPSAADAASPGHPTSPVPDESTAAPASDAKLQDLPPPLIPSVDKTPTRTLEPGPHFLPEVYRLAQPSPSPSQRRTSNWENVAALPLPFMVKAQALGNLPSTVGIRPSFENGSSQGWRTGGSQSDGDNENGAACNLAGAAASATQDASRESSSECHWEQEDGVPAVPEMLLDEGSEPRGGDEVTKLPASRI